MDEMKFRWTWLGCDVGGREVVYQLGGTEVARLIDRLGGTWFAIVDRQGERERRRDCTSYEAGRRGVELWAARHEARLRAEVQAKHEAWLSRQTWRRPAPEAAQDTGDRLPPPDDELPRAELCPLNSASP